jgi:proteic killer suppression protein
LTRRVELAPAATKALKSLPSRVVDKLLTWVAGVEEFGLENVRRIPGFHDEPLKGDRAGQRSIRLSIHYRAIYEMKAGEIRIVRVIEVVKHRY